MHIYRTAGKVIAQPEIFNGTQDIRPDLPDIVPAQRPAQPPGPTGPTQKRARLGNEPEAYAEFDRCRKRISTGGQGDCLFKAFVVSAASAGLSGFGRRAAHQTLRTRVGQRALGHHESMSKRHAEWQRTTRLTRRNIGASAPGLPRKANEYPGFISRLGEWGNQFDVALLAEELESLPTSQAVPRRLVVFDPRLGVLRIHGPPVAGGTLIPTAPIGHADVQGVDLVLGLDPGLHWWGTGLHYND